MDIQNNKEVYIIKEIDRMIEYGYKCISDNNQDIYFYINSNETNIIINSFNKENVTIKITENNNPTIYKIIDKYFIDMIELCSNEKNTYYNSNIIKYISENSLPYFANEFIIKKDKMDNHYELQSIYKSDEILGSLILITSESKEKFEILKNMLIEIKNNEHVYTKSINKKHNL